MRQVLMTSATASNDRSRARSSPIRTGIGGEIISPGPGTGGASFLHLGHALPSSLTPGLGDLLMVGIGSAVSGGGKLRFGAEGGGGTTVAAWAVALATTPGLSRLRSPRLAR